jgi:glycosyltransferase involved in cell wall biosynthesis
MFTITNGYDPDNFHPAVAPMPVRGPLRIAHTGSLHYGRDPRPFRLFLDALRDYERDPCRPKRIQVTFIGHTFDLAAEIRRRGLEEIAHAGKQVPYSQALAEMAGADVLLLLHSPGIRMGIPAKLFEYIGAGRPILALAEPDGDVAWVLKESGRFHRIVPPTDPGRIKQTLLDFVKEVTQRLVPPASEKPVLRFTRERMGKSLAETLSLCMRP